MHLDGAENGEHEQQRAQGENRGQRAEEVQDSLEEIRVHIPRKYSFLGDCGQPTGAERGAKATVVCPFLPISVVYFATRTKKGLNY